MGFLETALVELVCFTPAAMRSRSLSPAVLATCRCVRARFAGASLYNQERDRWSSLRRKSSRSKSLIRLLHVARFSALPLSGTRPGRTWDRHRSPSFADCARKAGPAGWSAAPRGAYW